MSGRPTFVFLCLATFFTLGALPGVAEESPDIEGIYDLEGMTIVEGSPERFVVTGKMVIRKSGAEYTTKIDASVKRTAGAAGPAGYALIGQGDAKLEGTKFKGTARMQSIISQVAGIDVAAPYMPKRAGPRFDTVADGEVVGDGKLEMTISSTLTGEGFTLPQNRRTTVTATRVARKATDLKTK